LPLSPLSANSNAFSLSTLSVLMKQYMKDYGAAQRQRSAEANNFQHMQK
jgi:hypothetical protein